MARPDRRAPLISVLAPAIGLVERRLERSPFVLGRDPECDLALDLPWISRRHLAFSEENGAWVVRREGKNEVRFNGAVLEEPRRLAPGDRLELGPMTIVFDVSSAADLTLVDRVEMI